MDRLVSFIRDAAWLNGERARIYSVMVCAAFAAMFGWIIYSHLFIYTGTGDPLGGDFVSFYAASKLALSGHAADAWRPPLHGAAEDSLFKGPHGYLAFFYPPPYILVCWPLALLPYPVALVVWIVATLTTSVAAMKLFFHRIAPDVKVGALVLLAFPGVWINMGCGQNGALTLALFALGFTLMDKRPLMAGLVLGGLVIKPQLAVILPFVLAAAALARPALWKTFFATAFSAAVLCLLAFALVGVDGYAAFFANSTYARESLNRGLVDPAIMQSLYAALRVFHVPMTAAYAAQALLSAAVIGMVCYAAWKHKPDGPAIGALAVSATLLVTPFMLDYDLLICALPMGWLVMNGAKFGARPWEKLVVLIVFVLPLFSRKLAMLYHAPVAPLVLLALFLMVVRRVMAAQPDAVSPAHPWQIEPAEALP